MKVTSSERIMSKIMALLDRANHSETPPAEAAACAVKAETLMAQYQIDRMDLKPEEKSKIVTEAWDIRVGGNYEFAAILRSMLETVIIHCGCRLNPKWTYARDENGAQDLDTRRYTIVGFPEDMRYAELIWFRVYKEFISNIQPKWELKDSIEVNAYNLAGAGIEWQKMVLMANDALDERIPVSEMEPVHWAGQRPKPVKGNRPLIRGIKMLRDGYKAECMRRGESYDYTRGRKTREAYRSSFAQSFNSTIYHRLDEMRRKAKQTVSDSDRYALAIIDTKEQVDKEFYKLFPEYDPEVRKRQQEAMDLEAIIKFLNMTPEEQAYVIDYEIKAEARWRNASSRARKGYAKVRENPYANVENSAWDRGEKVARRVNLRNDGEVKDQSRKGLE